MTQMLLILEQLFSLPTQAQTTLLYDTNYTTLWDHIALYTTLQFAPVLDDGAAGGCRGWAETQSASSFSALTTTRRHARDATHPGATQLRAKYLHNQEWQPGCLTDIGKQPPGQRLTKVQSALHNVI